MTRILLIVAAMARSPWRCLSTPAPTPRRPERVDFPFSPFRASPCSSADPPADPSGGRFPRLALPGISLLLALVTLAIWPIGADAATAKAKAKAKVWAQLSFVRNPDRSVTGTAVFKSKVRACALASTSKKGHAFSTLLFQLPFALAEAPFRNDPYLTTKPQFDMTRIGRGVLQVTVPADQPLRYMHWTGGASLQGTWETRTAPVSQAIFVGGPAEAFTKPATLKSGVTCTSGNYRPQEPQPI